MGASPHYGLLPIALNIVESMHAFTAKLILEIKVTFFFLLRADKRSFMSH